MSIAVSKLGSSEISVELTENESTKILIKLDSNYPHLNSGHAREILGDLFEEMNTEKKFRLLGIRILEILLKAEKKAHSENDFFKEIMHNHDHHSDETNLHEAQDIIIDIMGAVTGMEQLNIEPSAQLLSPVSVGSGFVNFSHGRLPVPAPATRIILEQNDIEWEIGPIDTELCTPTGASILAALGANISGQVNLSNMNVKSSGRARGTKDLEIPPLKIYLY